MKSLKASLVFTTINDPVILNDYVENFKKYNHLDQVEIIVIPDKKTPAAFFKRCEKFKNEGVNILYPTIDEQEEYLKKIKMLPHIIPYNSDNRRNVGFLVAFENGSDFIISIDDDNYCQRDVDFFGEHAIVCSVNATCRTVDSDSGWYNICDLLELDKNATTYARGFPYYARHKKYSIKSTTQEKDIHINVGLWLLDPDVDGISWLVNPVHVESFKGQSIILGNNTWSPINTQNTALCRDALVSYYYIKMQYPLEGMPIDRYGDIFSGYFAQACGKHLDGFVRFGTPIVLHKRNYHNYMNDAANEFACTRVLEDILQWLTIDAELEGSNYVDAYESLSHAIEDVVEQFSGKIWNDSTRAYFHQMGYYMRQWIKAIKTIGS